MTRRRRSPWGCLAVAAGLAVGLVPAPVHAQAPDFLFKSPKVSLGLRGGYAVAQASSDIFDFTREQLTLDRRDFDAPAWGGQLAVQVSPRVDIAFDVSMASTERKSEFRDWVDTNDLPIEQLTEFRRVPVTLGFKAYFKDRGRSVGRFAWIPTRWAPYMGAAAGWVWYRFEQDGDFVDFETYDIFSDRYVSHGNAPTLHAYGGADWTLSPGLFLTAEARYQWARAEMSGDFVDFDAMDLSGFQTTIGLSIRF